MKTYVVNELDCGDDPGAYRAWLEANAPRGVRVEWHERTGGGGGLYDEGGNLIDRNTYADPWDAYCNGRRWQMVPDYCTQNNGDCETCSLVSYGRDCRNNPV